MERRYRSEGVDAHLRQLTELGRHARHSRWSGVHRRHRAIASSTHSTPRPANFCGSSRRTPASSRRPRRSRSMANSKSRWNRVGVVIHVGCRPRSIDCSPGSIRRCRRAGRFGSLRSSRSKVKGQRLKSRCKGDEAESCRRCRGGDSCRFSQLDAIASAQPSPPPDPNKIQVLILTGQHVHDWRNTTPILKQILESTGVRGPCERGVPRRRDPRRSPTTTWWSSTTTTAATRIAGESAPTVRSKRSSARARVSSSITSRSEPSMAGLNTRR